MVLIYWVPKSRNRTVCVCVRACIACRMNKSPHRDSAGIIGDVEYESGEETHAAAGTNSLDIQLRAAYISCVLSTVNSTKSKKVPEIEIRGRQPILTLLMLT